MTRVSNGLIERAAARLREDGTLLRDAGWSRPVIVARAQPVEETPIVTPSPTVTPAQAGAHGTGDTEPSRIATTVDPGLHRDDKIESEGAAENEGDATRARSRPDVRPLPQCCRRRLGVTGFASGRRISCLEAACAGDCQRGFRGRSVQTLRADHQRAGAGGQKLSVVQSRFVPVARTRSGHRADRRRRAPPHLAEPAWVGETNRPAGISPPAAPMSATCWSRPVPTICRSSPAGAASRGAAELLSSQRMGKLLESLQARSRNTIVIVDARRPRWPRRTCTACPNAPARC